MAISKNLIKRFEGAASDYVKASSRRGIPKERRARLAQRALETCSGMNYGRPPANPKPLEGVNAGRGVNV